MILVKVIGNQSVSLKLSVQGIQFLNSCLGYYEYLKQTYPDQVHDQSFLEAYQIYRDLVSAGF